MTGRPPAIFLMGPTASGKTDLAVALVERLPLEIVSVDSGQVYRGLDIGSAKPGPHILARAPHRLIDIRDPEDTYSAADFRADALAAMAEIRAAGRVPLLVGGTGLYFRALERGLAPLPDADPGVRAALVAEARERGWAALHAELARVDPAAAARIHPNDPQRIQRALEVWRLTGRPLSRLQAEAAQPALPYRVLKLVRAPAERARLHARIERRFETMLARGFEAEVRRLLARPGLTPASAALRAVGYRQMVAFIQGEYDRETLVHRAVVATRRLARRQLTWFRAEAGAHWLDDRDPLGRALPLVKRFLG